jgi:hypothetical protein
MAVALFVGVVLLLAALYLFLSEAYFVHNASAFQALLVEVRHENVPRGRGSVLAYVPIVEVAIGNQRIRIPVDTFSEEEIYKVGSSMDVLCDLSSQRCLKNSFFDKWGNSLLDFSLSFVFLLIPGLCWRRSFKKRLGFQ